MVYLEIARVRHHPKRRRNRNPHGVRYRMAHPEELGAELLADVERAVRLHHLQPSAVQQPALSQLHRDQPLRQSRCVNWRVDLLEQVWQRADVVFVAVRNQYRPHLVAILHQVAEVRYGEIYARRHVLVGKHYARVYDDNVVAELERHHVLAYLAEAAQWNDQ